MLITVTSVFGADQSRPTDTTGVLALMQDAKYSRTAMDDMGDIAQHFSYGGGRCDFTVFYVGSQTGNRLIMEWNDGSNAQFDVRTHPEILARLRFILRAYLQRYCQTTKGLWQLVGGEASTGMSR